MMDEPVCTPEIVLSAIWAKATHLELGDFSKFRGSDEHSTGACRDHFFDYNVDHQKWRKTAKPGLDPVF